MTAVTDITNTVTVAGTGTFAVQAAQSGSWSATVTGAAAENAAASGNPVLVGGRYDSSARTLGNGDAGAIALNASGHVIADISAYVDGTATDDAAYTAGTGTGAVMMAFATSDVVDSGDVGAVAMDTSRNLKVSIEADNAGIGGGTEYTEDAAAPANPVGKAIMMERDDALGGLTPIAGDWTHAYCNANGALWVKNDGDIGATQSGTWNITNVSGTVSLPTGASTAANQSTIIGHVDGIEALLTTIDSDTSGITAGFAAEGAALGSGVLLQGDDGTDRKNINVDATTGDVQVDVTNTVTVDGSGVTQPVSAASLPLPSGASTAANQTTIIGHVDGIEGLLTTIDADTSSLAGAVSGSEVQVDVVGALPAGSNTIGTVNLSATDNTVLDNIDANTSRGSSHYRNVDANAESAIKASAGTLHWVHAMNMTAAVAYLHLYDATAASVTPGTTTPTFTFPIPTSGDTNGAGFNLRVEHDFANAITLVVTTTIDGSTGDPGTNGVFINAGYS